MLPIDVVSELRVHQNVGKKLYSKVDFIAY